MLEQTNSFGLRRYPEYGLTNIPADYYYELRSLHSLIYRKSKIITAIGLNPDSIDENGLFLPASYTLLSDGYNSRDTKFIALSENGDKITFTADEPNNGVSTVYSTYVWRSAQSSEPNNAMLVAESIAAVAHHKLEEVRLFMSSRKNSN